MNNKKLKNVLQDNKTIRDEINYSSILNTVALSPTNQTLLLA
jgi:hypothetical protein